MMRSRLRICVALACGFIFAAPQPFLFAGEVGQPALPRAAVPKPGGHWDQNRRVNIELDSTDLTTNLVIAKVITGTEVPEQIALMVKALGQSPATASLGLQATNVQFRTNAAVSLGRQRMEEWKARQAEEQVDWKKATWVPFTATMAVDLGPGDGRRIIWIAGRWEGGNYEAASGTTVRVIRMAPTVVITNPTTQVISQPMIQLQGYSVRPLSSIRYDLVNASRQLENEQGFVNHQEYDRVSFEFSTNYFTCYDIDLAPGTNVIVLRCQDFAGNTATNMLTYVLDLEHDKTPPVISLDKPINGHKISGGKKSTFTARGRLDDPTAKVTASIWAGGTTNVVEGLVERNGYFWLEDIPLGPGANTLLIRATDAAGNSSQTNVVVYRSEEILNIDPVPEERLNDLTTTVTGQVGPSSHHVWVNGVEAQVRADGTWMATNVPIFSPNGGTAVFEVTAVPSTEARPSGEKSQGLPQSGPPNALLSVATGLPPNAITLNAEHPACGVFKLHLAGIAGRSFVLQASTNLTDWVAILTNRDSKTVFDFEDGDANAYKCRFFRVMPVP